MAKKKMSKKTKYTLLGIGLVAVGAGYFIAKQIKKNKLEGIGAVKITDFKKNHYPYGALVQVDADGKKGRIYDWADWGNDYAYKVIFRNGEIKTFRGKEISLIREASEKLYDQYVENLYRDKLRNKGRYF